MDSADVWSRRPPAIFSVGPKPGQPFVKHHGIKYVKQNTVAWWGYCRVVAPVDSFYGGEESRPYVGKRLFNPTWRQLMREANMQIATTGDWHHIFLEGVGSCSSRYLDPDGISVIDLRLILGS